MHTVSFIITPPQHNTSEKFWKILKEVWQNILNWPCQTIQIKIHGVITRYSRKIQDSHLIVILQVHYVDKSLVMNAYKV